MSPALQDGLGIPPPGHSLRILNLRPPRPTPTSVPTSQQERPERQPRQPRTGLPGLPPTRRQTQGLQILAPPEAQAGSHPLTLRAPPPLSTFKEFFFQISLEKPLLFQKCELEPCLRTGVGQPQLLFSRGRGRKEGDAGVSHYPLGLGHPARLPGSSGSCPLTHPELFGQISQRTPPHHWLELRRVEVPGAAGGQQARGGAQGRRERGVAQNKRQPAGHGALTFTHLGREEMLRVGSWAASREPSAGPARLHPASPSRSPRPPSQALLIPLLLWSLRLWSRSRGRPQPGAGGAAVPPSAAGWQARPALPRPPEPGALGKEQTRTAGERGAEDPGPAYRKPRGSRAQSGGGAQAKELSGPWRIASE